MANRKDLRNKSRSEFLGILSPRQKPTLLTSVSQVMTPTRLPALFTSSRATDNRSYNPQQGAYLDEITQDRMSQSRSHTDLDSSPNSLNRLDEQKQTELEGQQRHANLDAVEDEMICAEIQLSSASRPNRRDGNHNKNGNQDGNVNHDGNGVLQTFVDDTLFFQQLESQIIPHENETIEIGNRDFSQYIPTSTSQESKNKVDNNWTTQFDLGPELSNLSTNPSNCDSGIFIPQQSGRSHTSSIGSNSLGSEYGSLSTRCSVCDGCSAPVSASQTLSNQHLYSHIPGQASSNQHLYSYRPGSPVSARQASSNQHLYSYKPVSGSRLEKRQTMLDSHDSVDYEYRVQRHDDSQTFSDDGLHSHPDLMSVHDRKCSEASQQTHTGKQGPLQSQNILSNIVLLVTWIQFSKQKDLQVEIFKQRKCLSDYERRLESMIVIVLMLSKQMKKSTSKLDTAQIQINQLKDKQVFYEKRLRRIYIGLCCMMMLYIVQMKSFRKHLYSLVHFFGIFEVFESINRTRKVVADNWRNIPSLLTDFWRIFIFRSRSKLRGRFS